MFNVPLTSDSDSGNKASHTINPYPADHDYFNLLY